MQDGNTGGFPFCNFSQAFIRLTSMVHGALLEPKSKTDKKSIVFFEEAPGLVSIRLIRPVLKTYASKPIKVYLTRMWANAQRDGRPAEYRWRPLFNAAKFG